MDHYEDVPYRLITAHDWADALQVQDACNLSGVVNSMLALIGKLRQEAQAQGLSWDWVDHHPILRLFAFKVNSLVGQEDLDFGLGSRYQQLEAICQRMSQKGD